MLLFISKLNVAFVKCSGLALCVYVIGHEGCVEVLLEQRDFRHFDGNPFTPLHCAVYVCFLYLFFNIFFCIFNLSVFESSFLQGQ